MSTLRSSLLVFFPLLLLAAPAQAQTPPVAVPDQPPQYTMKVAVDEVEITFHAADRHGVAVSDLKADEIRVLDNWKPPKRVLSFQSLFDQPLRAALLLDTSVSMQGALNVSKQAAQHFTEQIFRSSSDQAMVMDFGYSSAFLQTWTANPATLSRAIQRISIGRLNTLPGTAILDAIYRTCFYGFDKVNSDAANPDATRSDATANFILLFTDGEDNAGQMTLDRTLQACQHSNTAIYAFHFPTGPNQISTGPKLLRDLAEGTGGQVFRADDTPQALADDLKSIESKVRNRYRLSYTPANFAHDGAYHSIGLEMPDRVDHVDVRAGYFAPAR